MRSGVSRDDGGIREGQSGDENRSFSHFRGASVMEEIHRSAADLREAASLGEGDTDCEEMH
jgi:hypothetical protein